MTTPDNNDDATLDAIARQLEQVGQGSPSAQGTGPSPAAVPGVGSGSANAATAADPLVTIIFAIRDGLPQIALIPAFLGTRFTVPGDAEGEDVSTFKPLILSHEGRPFVPAYTGEVTLGNSSETASHRISSTGRELVSNLGEGFGVVINPGTTAETTLPSELIDALRADIKRHAL